MRLLTSLFALLLLPWMSLGALPSHPFDPLGTIPAGLGVNIHFTHARPGELEMLAAGGFRFVRMDFSWSHIEKTKGVYDFAAYDHLLADLDKHQIRAVLILDYANPHYDDNQSPRSPEGRAAFARFAAAAAQRYQGRGILWEMYNEPNISFWRPRPNTQDYIALALETGKAIRAAAPGEIYVGPATSGVPLDFLEDCFKAGLLDYFDAVTVHPYRQSPPETAADDLRKLRVLIDRYRPAGKAAIPVMSGEWGYSTAWAGFDEARQAKYLARQLLLNLASGIPLSIWYDWHDDGPDPKEYEHHFGTVRHDYHEGRTPPYDPKPSYLAMQTLARELAGYRFNKRLALESGDDYLLLFQKGQELKLVGWTMSTEERKVLSPAGPLTLTDTPVFIPVAANHVLLRAAADWDPVPLEVVSRNAEDVRLPLSFRNSQDRTINVNALTGETGRVTSGSAGRGAEVELAFTTAATRSDRPVPWRVELEVDGYGRVAQQTYVVAASPLVVTALPRMGRDLVVRVENPSGEAFDGQLAVGSENGESYVFPLRLAAGQKEAMVAGPIGGQEDGAAYQVQVSVADGSGKTVVHGPLQRFETKPLSTKLFDLIVDGKKEVKSEQSVADVTNLPPGLPRDATAVKLTYRFDTGWKFLRLEAKADELRKVDGQPTALGMWVHGDGSGNAPRIRFVDSTNQTFQSDGDAIKWTGWRYVVFPLDRSRGTSWGGKADGRIHYPIRIATLFLLDSAHQQATSGEVMISTPTLIYGPRKSDWVSAPAGVN